MVANFSQYMVEDIAAKTKNALVGGPFGSNLVTADYTPLGVPVIRGQNMGHGRWVNGDFVFVSEEKAEQLSANIARPGDLIFTQRGTLGQVAIVPERPFERYVVSQSQMKLTVDPSEADVQFLYYYFLSDEQQHYIHQNAIQTGVPHTNLTILRQTPVQLPPLDEQRAIAHVLGSLDDKIELNRRMNATLEATARAIFKSWFVDFDPVHARARSEQPSGMDAETAALFPDAFEDSELGPIPAGWQVEPIQNIATINEWSLSKRDDLEHIEYVEISSVTRGDVAEITHYTRGEEPSRARRRLRHGDTVLSTVRPDRGAYFLCLDPSPYLIASTGFAVITPVGVPWSLIYAALTQPDVSDYLGSLADGGAYPAVRPDVIGEWTVKLPQKNNLLNKFHEFCAPLLEHAEDNRHEIQALSDLRETLLPKLISGELNASNEGAVNGQRTY